MTSAEYQRQWRAANPEKVKKYQAANRAKRGLEYWRRATEKWRQENPERARALWRIYRSNRRAKMKGKIVIEEVSNWKSRICGICLMPIEGEYHLDHIVPLSKGGAHTTANLQLSHPFCNRSKYNKLTTQP